jgi:putative peptidoglycan lipid II flippase
MRKKIGRLNGREIFASFFKIAIASAVMSVVCYFSYRFLKDYLGIEGFVVKIIEAFVPIALGGIVFFIIAKLLKIEEVTKVYNGLARKFGLKK